LHHVLRFGSRRVSYVEAGDPAGRVMVLLHAFPVTARMWRPQLLTPPARWRLIAPDLAGFGETDDRAGEPPALDDYALDVLALLDRLDVRRAHVGGLSLGGYVTLAVARLAPDRVTGLVLADTKAPADSPEQRAGRDQSIATLEAGGLDALATAMLPRLVGRTTGTQEPEPELVAEIRAQVALNNVAGLRRALLRLRDRPDATAGLAAITVPTLVIVGDEDVATPVPEARFLAEHIRGARLEIVSGAGHLSNLERPEAFTMALTRFLTS
jgi:3-oxoadipate enol-lactonase